MLPLEEPGGNGRLASASSPVPGREFHEDGAPVAARLKGARDTAAVVHTGQHYDERMSEAFFRELEIPPPVANLEVGSGTAVAQTGQIMQRLEPVLLEHASGLGRRGGRCHVDRGGGRSFTASKLGLPPRNIEAGLRSFDRTMPEELNRIITDALSDRLFVSEPSGVANLTRAGIEVKSDRACRQRDDRYPARQPERSPRH